jgi:hypothetical protein
MAGASSKSLFEKGRRAKQPGAKLGFDNGAAETRNAVTLGHQP